MKAIFPFAKQVYFVKQHLKLPKKSPKGTFSVFVGLIKKLI